MPHELKWYYQEKVIRAHFTEPTTDAQIEDFDREMLVLLEQSQTPTVHCILDVSDLVTIPPPAKFRSLKWVTHPKKGWTVMVGMGGAKAFIASIISQLFKSKWRAFDTLPQAIKFLKEMDPSLEKIDKSPTP